MKRFHGITPLIALALALAAFTGTAVAGNGNGGSAPGNSGSAPGQQKQDPAAQPQPAPAAQPAPAQPAAKTAPGQAKKSSTATGTSQPGVKPSNITKKNTHTTVGANPDVSKRYGNGETAAQIAASRGAKPDTALYGPGNSQPHKVATCKHPLHGKGGGVDVHAVKSYDTAACASAPATAQPQQQSSQATVCGQTVQTTSSVVGMMHKDGKGRDVHLMTNPKSAHFQPKHGGTPVTVTSTKTVATGENCSSQQSTNNSTSSNTNATNSSTPNAQTVLGVQLGRPAASVQAAGQSPSAGGVLGAQATLTKPAARPAHGVLGAVGRLAGTSLPFTGLALWIAVLIAAALIGGGLLVRRGSTGRL